MKKKVITSNVHCLEQTTTMLICFSSCHFSLKKLLVEVSEELHQLLVGTSPPRRWCNSSLTSPRRFFFLVFQLPNYFFLCIRRAIALLMHKKSNLVTALLVRVLPVVFQSKCHIYYILLVLYNGLMHSMFRIC